jgi:hypothetical protein
VVVAGSAILIEASAAKPLEQILTEKGERLKISRYFGTNGLEKTFIDGHDYEISDKIESR